jgi:hypothetical protein
MPPRADLVPVAGKQSAKRKFHRAFIARARHCYTPTARLNSSSLHVCDASVVDRRALPAFPVPRAGRRFFKLLRQITKSIDSTLKAQLDLERHGRRAITGVAAGILQGILALTAASGTTTAPTSRFCDDQRPTTADPWISSSSPTGADQHVRTVSEACWPLRLSADVPGGVAYSPVHIFQFEIAILVVGVLAAGDLAQIVH